MTEAGLDPELDVALIQKQQDDEDKMKKMAVEYAHQLVAQQINQGRLAVVEESETFVDRRKPADPEYKMN